MNPKLVVSTLIFAIAAASSAQAQVIDTSKITCEDYIFYKISNPNAVAYWLSGYYHGKQNDPVINPQILQANADKVRSYCDQQKNYKVALMQAAEQILDISKDALAAASTAQAQVIDASKITCEIYIFKIFNPNAFAEWLSGYYHGKRNDPIFNPQILQENADKVRSYCDQQKNWKVTLMQAAEQILDIGK